MLSSILCFFALFAGLSTITNASLLSNREYAASFSSWMAAGHRTYSADELMSKFAVWKANHYYVERHNAEYHAGRKTFQLEMNANADLTLVEYRKKLGLRSRTGPQLNGTALELGKSLHGSNSTNATLTSSTGKDWRGTPFLGPVKNQLSCGSCWSFASTTVLQSSWALKSGNLETFSEQQLVDCVNDGENGCDVGGVIAESWDYVLAGSRPMSEESYPYTATSGGSCKYNAAKASQAKFSHAVQIPESDEAALAQALNTVPAIAVAIDASTQEFQLYKSGVFTSTTCGNNWENLDHAVTVVGYGNEDGHDYWVVQNSWDTTWGENGYIRMARNKDNMCGVAKDASYVVA